MEPEVVSIQPSPEGEKILYTEKTILLSTALGGPIAGTYFISRNFRELAREAESRIAWIVGLTATLVFVPLVLLLPEDIVLNPLFRFAHVFWSIPAYLVVQIYQRRDIEQHIAAGGKKGSAWKAAGVAVLSLIPVLVYATVLSMTLFQIKQPDLPNFEPALVQGEHSGCQVFYDSTALSQSDAKVTAAILEKVGYFTHQTPDMQAIFYKSEGEYVIAFTVPMTALSNQEIRAILAKAAKELESVYSQRKYHFRLLGMDNDGFQGEATIMSE